MFYRTLTIYFDRRARARAREYVFSSTVDESTSRRVVDVAYKLVLTVKSNVSIDRSENCTCPPYRRLALPGKKTVSRTLMNRRQFSQLSINRRSQRFIGAFFPLEFTLVIRSELCAKCFSHDIHRYPRDIPAISRRTVTIRS